MNGWLNDVLDFEDDFMVIRFSQKTHFFYQCFTRELRMQVTATKKSLPQTHTKC